LAHRPRPRLDYDGDTYELSVKLPAETAWAALDALEAGAPAPVAVGIFEREDQNLLVWAHYPTPTDAVDFARLISAATGRTIPPDELKAEVLAAGTDWIARSRAALAPVRAGRFIVHGAHDRLRYRACRWALEIDAGQAFGSAHHASTLGCLLALHEQFKTPDPKVRSMDLGTGTGVLAIAAAKLVRGAVLATDVDPIAVAIARENMRRNGVAPLVEVIEADGTEHPAIRGGGPYDLVTANILARPLVTMAPRIANLVARAAILILSGLTGDQVRPVEAAYRAAGFRLVRRRLIGGWATLVLRMGGNRRRRSVSALARGEAPP
jgi:ribosomal protein L11 methyltransferase